MARVLGEGLRKASWDRLTLKASASEGPPRCSMGFPARETDFGSK